MTSRSLLEASHGVPPRHVAHRRVARIGDRAGAAVPPGSNAMTRAAANSMASGTPSRRWQISTTARALLSVSAKSALTRRARSTNKLTASVCTRRSMSSPGSPTASGGSAISCSPSMAIPSRLVASTTTAGQDCSMRLTRRATAPSTCSQLSNTSRSCFWRAFRRDCPLGAVHSDWLDETLLKSPRRRRTDRSPVPTRRARRLPGNGVVRPRRPAAPTGSSHAANPGDRHDSRLAQGRRDPGHFGFAPNKRADLCRKVSGERVQAAKRREVFVVALARELENPCGPAKVTQTVLTEIYEFHTGRQLTPHEHLGGTGNNHLPAVGGSHQARAPIDRQAGIVGVVDDHCLVGVQSGPGPQRACGAATALPPALVGTPPPRRRHPLPLRRRRPFRRPCGRTRNPDGPRPSSPGARRGGPWRPASRQDPAPTCGWTLRGR